MICFPERKMQSVVVAALYKFAKLPDYRELQKSILEVCQKNGVFGSILLATEGINGTVAGNRQGIDALLKFLRSEPRFSDLEHKESFSQEMPFDRMKVKLKKEIVPLGVPGNYWLGLKAW